MAPSLKKSRNTGTERFLEMPTEENFRLFFLEQAPVLVLYFRGWGCDQGTAEDLTQDVLLSVYRHVHQLRERDSFGAWMFRIARNAVGRQWRKLRPERENLRLEEIDEKAVAGMARSPEFLDSMLVTECLKSLPENEREIMILRYLHEMEYHEIAQTLGMPLGTVQWKLFEARKKLAASFGPRAEKRA